MLMHFLLVLGLNWYHCSVQVPENIWYYQYRFSEQACIHLIYLNQFYNWSNYIIDNNSCLLLLEGVYVRWFVQSSVIYHCYETNRQAEERYCVIVVVSSIIKLQLLHYFERNALAKSKYLRCDEIRQTLRVKFGLSLLNVTNFQ